MRAVKAVVAGAVVAAVLVAQPVAGDALAEERTIVSFVEGTSAVQQVGRALPAEHPVRPDRLSLRGQR